MNRIHNIFFLRMGMPFESLTLQLGDSERKEDKTHLLYSLGVIEGPGLDNCTPI